MKINARCWRLDLWSGSTGRRRRRSPEWISERVQGRVKGSASEKAYPQWRGSNTEVEKKKKEERVNPGRG